MGEFASGYLSSASGPIRNAYDPRRSASGSSGGTGSGIAASFSTIGIGEDTGGSIRGPAAVNNILGLRPTLPLVSRHGMSPARPSTDTLGPITRRVRDAAIVLDVIAGYDPADPITASAVGHTPASYTDALARDGLRGARIGIIREPMRAGNASSQTAGVDQQRPAMICSPRKPEPRFSGLRSSAFDANVPSRNHVFVNNPGSVVPIHCGTTIDY
jgi:amidase